MASIFKKIIVAAWLSFSFLPGWAQDTGRTSFDNDWLFKLEGGTEQKVTLPHDWAIHGEFSKDNPSGTGGGALPGGIGWYTKSFVVDAADNGKNFRITFDGAYMNATVWINGHELGTRPYGYMSFTYDLTPYLKFGKTNEMKVKVDNSDQPNSRWYSGCGIYRHVWLTKTNAVHVAQDGTYVTTPSISNERATVRVVTDVVNPKGQTVEIVNTIQNAEGKEVAQGGENLTVQQPHRWSVRDPYLYTVVTRLYDAQHQLLDEYHTRFGIRTAEFKSNGFFLNGEAMQIQGVCNHHDQGALGSAINRRALQRQLQMLKDAGFTGIRCSHNPPAPELLELCDEMGLIVMDEAFDMWRKNKTAHDYARFFDEWHERDLHDFVVRDRNHPCVVMWSIGNEVLEQWSDAKADTLSLEQANLILNFGHSKDMLAADGTQLSVNSLLARKLADLVHKDDPTRPITAGCNEPDPGNHLFRSGAIDIIGYNYHNGNIPDVPKNFPGKPFIITESNSSLMTRGYYRMPSDSVFIWPSSWDKAFDDPSFACSSYDNCHVPWGNSNEETLLLMRKYPWIGAQFIWTGFDYLGEPTPYGWPARSSYFGLIDLAGFPKDIYYLYQAELTDKPVLHLFPHWNWTEGQDIDLWAYYNQADEVELFVNGKSQGVSSKTADRLHAFWRVKYESGEVMAVARKNGQVVRTQTIRTAGKPHHIRLTADRPVITADGRDLSYVTVEVVDEQGNLCPNADNQIYFELKGNATIAGVDNGSPISLEKFTDNKRKAFYGKCLVILQNSGSTGDAVLTAKGDQLQSAELTVQAR